MASPDDEEGGLSLHDGGHLRDPRLVSAEKYAFEFHLVAAPFGVCHKTVKLCGILCHLCIGHAAGQLIGSLHGDKLQKFIALLP